MYEEGTVEYGVEGGGAKKGEEFGSDDSEVWFV